MFEQHDTPKQDPAAGTQAAAKTKPSPTPFPREWIRPKEVIARFGIGRTRLYALIKEGKIDAVSLHSPGEKQGTRLIRYASLTGYLENLLAEVKKGGAA